MKEFAFMSLERLKKVDSPLDGMLSGSGGNFFLYLIHYHLEGRRNEVSLKWQLIKKQQLLILGKEGI